MHTPLKVFLASFALLLQLSGVAQPLTAYVLILHGPGCDDQSGSLVVTPVGGTGEYTYLWDDGSTNDTITGLGAGPHTVTVFSGTESDDATVTLEPFGIDSVIVSHACSGMTGWVYLDNVYAAYPLTYTWIDCGGAVLAEDGPTLSNIGAGCYAYQVVDAEGCTISGTATVHESNPVLEAFVSDSVLCYGESAQIWYTPGFLLYDTWGLTFNSTTDTVFYINQMGSVNSFPQYGVDSLGCEVQVESNNLFVYQQGHPDPVQLYNYGDTISAVWGIVTEPSLYYIYIWRRDGEVVDSSAHSYLAIDTSGFYSVSIFNEYGCSFFGTLVVQYSGVGMDDMVADGIRVSGNPAAPGTPWAVELPAGSAPVRAQLLDALGRPVATPTLMPGRNLIGADLPGGMYILSSESGNLRLMR